MNFHSKNKPNKYRLALETVKSDLKNRKRNEPLLFRKEARESSETVQTFQHESLILAQDERWRRA